MKSIYSTVCEIVRIFNEKRITKAAAALAYSLLFALFPFLICLNSLMSNLHLTQARIIMLLESVVPDAATELLCAYFDHITENRHTSIFIAGVVGTFTTAHTAFRMILNTMVDVHEANALPGVKGMIKSFFLSITFLGVVYMSCIVILCGEWLLRAFEKWFDENQYMPFWQYARFLVMFFVVFAVIYVIYKLSAPYGHEDIPRLKGAFAASFIMAAASMLFSYFISISVRYELIYGSIASVIIMLLWLYILGCVLFLGNVVNIVIYRRKNINRTLQ